MPTAPAKSATGNLSGFMPADAVEIVERKVSRYQSARDNKGKPIALVEILEAIQAGHWENPVAAIRYGRELAIRMKCTECFGWETDPAECTAPLCPLYPFRGLTRKSR
ncbi:MAG: hypothetical protein BWX54_01484 [Verrucomicrobia bacterium ADurb.Bin018]|nr:MAG: hypothetical protein BWX54_01484 [Verrucomicrobia bacterium ADurb.Bin018]